MDVVQCTNGHFFDKDIYSACPHCGAGIASNATRDGGGANRNGAEQKKRKSLFGFSRTKKQTLQEEQKVTFNSGNGSFSSVSASGRESVSSASDNNQNGRGVFQQSNSAISTKKDTTVDMWGADDDEGSEANGMYEKKTVLEVETASGDIAAFASPAIGGSLRENIAKASANAEGKTMGYFNAMTQERAITTTEECIDPVVGWLVCVGGSHFGQSFEIGAGMNSVGRNESNRIVLSRDAAVSREKHTLIVYEPKKRNFFIQPGDGGGLTYVNDEYITESRILCGMDTIEMGQSKFLFVPLCSDSFLWEDYMKQRELSE